MCKIEKNRRKEFLEIISQFVILEDDFVSDYDLYIACLILQKQIEHIDGKKENIVIPSIRMKQIRERNGKSHSKNQNIFYLFFFFQKHHHKSPQHQ